MNSHDILTQSLVSSARRLILGRKWIIEKIKTPNVHLNQCDGCGTAPSLDLTLVEILWFEVKSSFKCSTCAEEGPGYSRNVFSLFWHYRKRCNVVKKKKSLCSIRGPVILQLTICNHKCCCWFVFCHWHDSALCFQDRGMQFWTLKHVQWRRRC